VVAYLRAATGGRPYTGGCINLMWTDLGPGIVEPQLLQITNVHTTACIRSSERRAVVYER
jgi:hypothetical protein